MEEKLNRGEKLLTAEEAAELIGLNPATLRKMAWQRRIRSFKVLGALRFKQSDLEQLIMERPATTTDAAKKVAAQQSSFRGGELVTNDQGFNPANSKSPQ